MKLGVFALLFAVTVFAVDDYKYISKDGSRQHLDSLIECDKHHKCKEPLGCFEGCYATVGPNGEPIKQTAIKILVNTEICGNFCVNKNLKCKEDSNCPIMHYCHTKSGECKSMWKLQ